MACGAGVASAQPGGGEPQQLLPKFWPPVVFDLTGIGGPYGIASADFLDANGNPGQDGFPEIAVAGAGGGVFFSDCNSLPTDHDIRVLRNTGSWATDPSHGLVQHGEPLEIAPPNNDIWASELAFADVTGVNGPDLVVLGYDPVVGAGYLFVYQNQGDGTFAPHGIPWTTSEVTLRGLVTADFDLDGDIDVVAAGSDCDGTGGPSDKIIVFENRLVQDDEFDFRVNLSVDLNIPGGYAPGDLVAGDFYPYSPGQPLPDLATPNPLAASISTAANFGSLNFIPVTEPAPSGCSWAFVTAASGRFGSDSEWDIAGVLPESLFAGVFRGQGSGSFESYCANPTLGYQLFPPDFQKLHAHGIDAGEVNGAPYLDLVVALRQDEVQGVGPEWHGAVAVLLGKSNGTFQAPSATQAYVFPAFDPDNPDQSLVAGTALVEVVDLNADGFDDIVVTNNESENISVLINKLVVTSPGG